ncbi:MAG: MFS transporter [Anaerovoracaceae bacterium]|uniref:MFS transporter n=1 Tax=Candidatus Allocopromorpha excrementavium TaxID=2840741 RepID=A0A9D1KV54_9FIRM|nr:MFS transporter [Candidatus Copromorpha excrementavium]
MDRRKYKYAVLYNFSYMSIGAFLPLVGQYMSAIGFSGSQIGSITATGTAVAIFASAFWGRCYSAAGRKYAILMMLCIMSSAVCFVLKGINEYAVFLVTFGIMYFFQAPVMSLTDAFTVEMNRDFGGLRAWGAVGFALGVFLAGICVDIFDLSIIFWFYIVSFILAACAVAGIGKEKRSGSIKKAEEPRKASGGYIAVLKNKKLRYLIICAFFMGGTNVANNTYFSFLYIEGGGTVAGVGTAMLLMVGSEVPFMAWCSRLSKRFTTEKLLAAAMMISAARFMLYGTGLPWWGLICLFFTQGAVNGIILIEFVRYAAELAERGYENLAISAYYIIGSNLSTICCQLIGGFILDYASASGVYMFFGFFNLCGVILYFIFGLYRGEKKL